MGQKLLYSIVIILVICTSLVSAAPGIPHQFYGNVEVNNQPVPDNTVIVATVEGDTYTTITTDGKYGYSPNIFYVEDPDGNRAGSTIIFSIGGKEVGSYVFENNGYTNLDFSTTTTCPDDFCLGDETCSTCPEDCGSCKGPPVITIHSPIEGQTYDTTKIDLDVSADQEILVWMYSLNTAAHITFTPNITITVFIKVELKQFLFQLNCLNHIVAMVTKMLMRNVMAVTLELKPAHLMVLIQAALLALPTVL